LRESYLYELIKEIRGPRYGVHEILLSNPSTEYLTGVFIPKGCKIIESNPDSEQTRSEGDDPYDEDGRGELDDIISIPNELDPQIKPKSFGISFIIESPHPEIEICVTWARYKSFIADKNPDSETKNCKSDINWERIPFFSIVHAKINNTPNKNYAVYEGEDGSILINIRMISLEGDKNHVIVSLINDLKVLGFKGEELTPNSIFQPSIRINLCSDNKLVALDSEKESTFDYLYQDQPIFARGHMCSAIWKSADYQQYLDETLIWPERECFKETSEFVHCDVRSEFIPLYSAVAPGFNWREEYSQNFPEFSAYNLSEMWRSEDIEKYLTPLLIGYEKWILENELLLNKSQKKNIISTEIIQNQKKGLMRLREGIECLKKYDDARLAFCFANRVLWLQNIWKTKNSINDVKGIEFNWRPFQLTFFLNCLESLYNFKSDYRDVLDLLWVPTGGGKTEAYLAIMAFTIALRRRRAINKKTDSKINEAGGVSIITRYTLRLLTVQQFRRTLLMITAAEYLRVYEIDGKKGWRPKLCSNKEDWIFGALKFSVGMWVGGAVSPNHLRREKDGAIHALKTKVHEGEPAQIVKCPVCNSWLSIPRSGLSEGRNDIFLIIKSDKDKNNLSIAIEKYQGSHFLKTAQIVDNKLPDNYYTLKIVLDSTKKVSEEEFDNFIRRMETEADFKTISFRPSRPGYFPVPAEPSRKKDSYLDFKIFCPNPNCDLNNIGIWKEGTPCSGNLDEIGTSGLFNQVPIEPFSAGKWMPIPAYTTDEQIYHQCPSVIISTVDKIARLAFEPRAGAIFGGVTKYNRYYGYLRGNSEAYLPEETLKGALREKDTVDVKPFLPPDLIVQDELHLIDGPLGSLFGLYETIVDGLIHHAGGKPKYIASSATVKRAENQIELIFNRKTFQFPPNGLTFKDSFFINFPDTHNVWDEQKPGKIYLGVYAPGMGALTSITRIWARILKTSYDLQSEKRINNFWTIVGYFNSIRELGGNRSLYREDIVERLNQISEKPSRTLDAEKVVELSSRINSTDIPQILEDLEQGKYRSHNENPDAIFTTSMFGTGVDIPHLSMMVVNGQPKTTSQYIQATGRVGREYGALVTVFYKSGRPRDLSHYELFTGYHSRINLSVEPASIAPFSKGCLERGGGPAMVAFLRNVRDSIINWNLSDGHIIQSEDARNDLLEMLHVCFEKREMSNTDVLEFLKSQFDMWERISVQIGSDFQLKFNEYTLYNKALNHVVLGDPAHELKENIRTVFKNAPISLRDIEETTSFEV